MGVIPNPKMAFIFPISCILALIFPIFMKYFPKCSGKGSFPKSQIKSLIDYHIWNFQVHLPRRSARAMTNKNFVQHNNIPVHWVKSSVIQLADNISTNNSILVMIEKMVQT